MLLRRFASDPRRERIWALDLGRDRIEELRLEQVAVVKDFYSWIDESDGSRSRDPWFEQWLGEGPEAEAGPILDKLEAGLDPDPRDTTKLIVFLLLQTVRTTLGQALLRHELQEQFRRIRELMVTRRPGEAVMRIEQLFYRLKHREPTPEERIDWYQRLAAEATGMAPPSEPSRNALITHIIRALYPVDAQPLAAMAASCRLCRYGLERDRLVLSDAPATFADLDHDGVISDWTERPPRSLSLPISPRCMIELRRADAGVPGADAWESHVEDLNERTWSWAERWVFAAERDLLDSIRNERRRNPRSPLPADIERHRRRR